MNDRREESFFELVRADSASGARAGVLRTAHSVVETPVFMPVGTQATVKALSPADLDECGCSIILANTYHLHLRPGDALVAEAGGLHSFEHWNKSILTDSGGFQVFSLRDISKITDDGVWFQSYIDGSKHFFSPERSVEIQRNLGADIIMMFDECPSARAGEKAIASAVDRTLQWARRCLDAQLSIPLRHATPQALFAIVQGGTSREQRRRCAEELGALAVPGYALGGLAVGESAAEMYDTAEYTCGLLPRDKPRYLMGVGTPENILECIGRGVDMFDCVLPTRNARNGTAFSWNGAVHIRNACNTRDFSRGIDHSCGCYACRNFSRAYLRHLFCAGEILSLRLLTLHNVYFYMELVRRARESILAGTFVSFRAEALLRMKPVPDGEEPEGKESHEQSA
ncbi:MAG TPA: tRNA guanosine(34) transglycosylase Tgt [Chitinivibrionales bacterium]|jgi:queuine tRNA-ribosyltransferase|nr:tRNA guanosine(34) transglycosylase Tgt [Chitinivibrionales bacterium]